MKCFDAVLQEIEVLMLQTAAAGRTMLPQKGTQTLDSSETVSLGESMPSLLPLEISRCAEVSLRNRVTGAIPPFCLITSLTLTSSPHPHSQR